MADTEDTKDRAFFNAQDGVKGRDGGPYLDYEERYKAEVRRAVLEDREPIAYGENVPASTGTQLVVGALVQDNSHYSNPSMRNAPGLEVALNKDNVLEDTEYLADPVSVLPVSQGTVAPDDVADATTNGAPSGSPTLDNVPQGFDTTGQSETGVPSDDQQVLDLTDSSTDTKPAKATPKKANS